MAEKTRSVAEGNQPISRHPLFPAIVALWFGALFGLVSLAIKPELIEQIIVASGIHSIVPMAAPPLGTTMRILLALAMTGIGAVTGALIALRIARPEPEVLEHGLPRRSRTEKTGLTLAAPRGTDKTGPAPFPDTATRKPASEPAILNVSDFDLGGYGDQTVEPASEPAPAGDRLFDTCTRETIARPAAHVEAPEAGCTPLADKQEPAPEPPVPPARDHRRAAARIVSAELDRLSHVELLERLALAMARARDAAVREELDASAAAQGQPETEDYSKAERRFAAEAEAPLPEIASFSCREAVEAEAAALPVPAALRPVGRDSPDNDDTLPGYVPPRHIAMAVEDSRAAAQAQPLAFDDDEDVEEDVMEEGYSSLLDLSRSSLARARFTDGDGEADAASQYPATARADDGAAHDEQARLAAEPPSAVSQPPFDGLEPPDRDDTERALRAALATLQRMSGAA
ncbi:MAG TPA: hypothetical protein VJQ77_06410 [Novosphingobium sp.]|nr:hypothetical protein [Novosphingobium sp.]